uniref:Orofacial cleft 1 candidate gene 1 protein n=1 Tax=Cynoglossus semilaevis TaxID=244447 RepID=A0A3P8VJT8_CYNSE
MGRDEKAHVEGIENPAFDRGGSAKLSVPLVWLEKEIRGDRPDSTLVAHQKKMELQAPAKERGDEQHQNYFDPSSVPQTDPRHCRTAEASTEDELELNENRLYHRMARLLDEEDTFIDIPGTPQPSRDEEVCEVKSGDPGLQQRMMLHSGGHASGSRPSQSHTTAKTQAQANAGLGGEGGPMAGRMVMGSKSAVKTRIAEEVIPHYTQQLRERVQPDMITLGSLSLQQKVAQKGQLKSREWAKTGKRLIAFLTGNTKEPHIQEASALGAEEAPQPRLNTLFQCGGAVESPSLRVLGEGQEEAAAKSEQMTELPASFSSAPRPMWQENSSTSPQPVELCVRCLRATRDKLPRGHYSVSVSLNSRLGASAAAWCAAAEQRRWTVSTEPTEHQGHVYDTDLHINQNLVMVLPAACQVVPSMVLIFQLNVQEGVRNHISSVLAWGAFPVCGPNLNVIQGRFKTPLLRGEPNMQLDQFKKMEGLISSDLDHWLCNMYFQVKRLPLEVPGVQSEQGTTTPTMSPAKQPVTPQHEAHHDQHQRHLPLQPLPSSVVHCQSQLQPQTQLIAGPSSRARDPTVVNSLRGSPLHLSADSACSSSSLPGTISGNTGEKAEQFRAEAEVGSHYKKKPIKKTNSCGLSVISSSAPPRQAGKQKTQHPENLSAEEMEEYTFSLQSPPTGPRSRAPCLSVRARLALRMLSFDLGLPSPGQQQRRISWRCSVRQLSLIMLLMALMWFVRLYLHYCSQWLYLQAIAVPVNKFQFHTHTVELVYQSSLLHIWEEVAMLVVGPLTLNALTFLLVLIRWGCQQIFGSLPSFTSKFIMAQGVWTVLDPLAVFAVDTILGHLIYSPDTPVADAAKLYWHFYRADQSGAAGVVLTLFLYIVIFLLSITILSIYLLRFHNDGRMLDVFQRLTAKEGMYLLPQDMELSNQELSYIVKKAEQWRGFNGERRKVVVFENIWASEDQTPDTTESSDHPQRDVSAQPAGEINTHVVVYTLYLSGMKQKYRHFLRESNGAIIEVVNDTEDLYCAPLAPSPRQGSANQRESKAGVSAPRWLRRRKKLFCRSHRVEPVGGSGCGSSFALQDISQ